MSNTEQMLEILRETNEACCTIIDDCEQTIEWRKGCLLGNNSLVEIAGMYLKILKTESLSDGTYKMTEWKVTTNPAKASHLTPKDAKAVAAGIKNGLGDTGKAVLWRDACEDAIKRQYETLDFMGGHAYKKLCKAA